MLRFLILGDYFILKCSVTHSWRSKRSNSLMLSSRKLFFFRQRIHPHIQLKGNSDGARRPTDARPAGRDDWWNRHRRFRHSWFWRWADIAASIRTEVKGLEKYYITPSFRHNSELCYKTTLLKTFANSCNGGYIELKNTAENTNSPTLIFKIHVICFCRRTFHFHNTY